jgi:hypothetical protein
MKRALITVVLVIIVCCMEVGCASTQLSTDATPAEKNAAYCKDVQTGLAIATIAIAQPQDPDGKAYWDSYMAKVQAAFTAYCAN